MLGREFIGIFNDQIVSCHGHVAIVVTLAGPSTQVVGVTLTRKAQGLTGNWSKPKRGEFEGRCCTLQAFVCSPEFQDPDIKFTSRLVGSRIVRYLKSSNVDCRSHHVCSHCNTGQTVNTGGIALTRIKHKNAII